MGSLRENDFTVRLHSAVSVQWGSIVQAKTKTAAFSHVTKRPYEQYQAESFVFLNPKPNSELKQRLRLLLKVVFTLALQCLLNILVISPSNYILLFELHSTALLI